MNKLASLERVLEVKHHPNADRLDIIKVLGYDCIVGRDQYKVDDYIIFIQPDSILPAEQEWCQDLLRYTSRGRIKAARLRGEWSMGLVVETARAVKAAGGDPLFNKMTEGDDYTSIMGVTKYEPPLPKDVQARRALPHNIPRTDEERWQNLRNMDSLIGQPVDVTLKIDGSSFTAYVKLNEDGTVDKGVTSRSLDLKLDEGFTNRWLEAERKYNLLEKLENYCREHGVSLAVRGEVYGEGIQTLPHNPHCRVPLDLAIYSVWSIDEMRYFDPMELHYSLNVAHMVGVPHVPVIADYHILSKELIDEFDHKRDKVGEQSFEGVVVRGKGFSFKIINKHYDSHK